MLSVDKVRESSLDVYEVKDPRILVEEIERRDKVIQQLQFKIKLLQHEIKKQRQNNVKLKKSNLASLQQLQSSLLQKQVQKSRKLQQQLNIITNKITRLSFQIFDQMPVEQQQLSGEPRMVFNNEEEEDSGEESQFFDWEDYFGTFFRLSSKCHHKLKFVQKRIDNYRNRNAELQYKINMLHFQLNNKKYRIQEVEVELELEQENYHALKNSFVQERKKLINMIMLLEKNQLQKAQLRSKLERLTQGSTTPRKGNELSEVRLKSPRSLGEMTNSQHAEDGMREAKYYKKKYKELLRSVKDLFDKSNGENKI